MQFEYTHPQTDIEAAFGGFFCINAFGRIEPGDDLKFEEFLVRSAPPPRTTVYIDSSGGDVGAAIAMGRIIRGAWFATAVGKYLLNRQIVSGPILERRLHSGKCFSAATLMYLGGRLRYLDVGAEFGVHQFSFKNPSPQDIGRSQVLSARIASYISDMGISLQFIEISSLAESRSLKIIDEGTLKALQIVTGGQTDVTWTTQARATMLYVRGEKDTVYGHHKVMLAFSRSSGFLFIAVIEAQGREEELTKFPLVEIVINDDEHIIDISGRCERIVHGIYVNVLSKIDQQEARLIAYSEAFGVRVRFSNEASIFLGTNTIETAGGEEQLQTLFSTLCDDVYI